VTFKDPLTGKENTLSVHEIRRDRIEGLTMTRDFIDSDRVVYADRILDWSYRVGNKYFGGFRMKALIALREKQLASSAPSFLCAQPTRRFRTRDPGEGSALPRFMVQCAAWTNCCRS
jgi:hypothetical protein